MITVGWYFDFISPFSYFSLLQLERLRERARIEYHPILFAALLNHWEHKGPAEIKPKREWTYRWCTWWAARNHIPFRMPAVHPFNPIPYLRLALAADCNPDAIRGIFSALWTDGIDPRDLSLVDELAQRLGIEKTRIEQPSIKNALRANTDRAIALGVFGVPAFHVRDQVFWGADSLPFVEDYLADPTLFDQPEMQRATHLPTGVERR
jgi:2-hydroxychromene-2-carboxylate isomerase